MHVGIYIYIHILCVGHDDLEVLALHDASQDLDLPASLPRLAHADQVVGHLVSVVDVLGFRV